LVQELSGPTFTRGDSFYSLREISGRYGVSTITSRRVLDELSARNLIVKIQGKGSFVTQTRVRQQIRFILPVSTTFSSMRHDSLVAFELFQGFTAALTRANCSMTAVSPELLVRHRLEPGSLLLTTYEVHRDALGRDDLARFGRDGHRVVCCHAVKPVPGVPTVGSDYEAGSAMAVTHLAARGHRRIGLLTAPVNTDWCRPRFAGYYAAVEAGGLDLDLGLIREIDVGDPDDVYSTVRALLAAPDPPTAVLAVDRQSGLAALACCRAQGLRVPDDVALVCFDNTYATVVADPPLTVIDLRWQDQGARAVELLLDLAEGNVSEPRHEALEPKLVVRDST